MTAAQTSQIPEIADGRVGINHRLVPTLNRSESDNESLAIDRWTTEERIELAEIMVRRWQAFIEQERIAPSL